MRAPDLQDRHRGPLSAPWLPFCHTTPAMMHVMKGLNSPSALEPPVGAKGKNLLGAAKHRALVQ